MSSNLQKLNKITPELSAFLGIDNTIMLSRVDITGRLCNYIKARKLKNDINRNRFNLDFALNKLFGDYADLNKTLSFFEIQKYISKHIIQ